MRRRWRALGHEPIRRRERDAVVRRRLGRGRIKAGRVDGGTPSPFPIPLLRLLLVVLPTPDSHCRAAAVGCGVSTGSVSALVRVLTVCVGGVLRRRAAVELGDVREGEPLCAPRCIRADRRA